MLKQTGETEGETEPKKIKKKREKKRDVETTAEVTAAPLPLPGSLVKGQRKSASSFFKELREELHSASAAPSAPPSGAEVPAANVVSLSAPENNSRLVEVVEFQSRSKRKPKPDQDEHAKVCTCVIRLPLDSNRIGELEKGKDCFGNSPAVWPHLSPENDLFAQSLGPGRKFHSEAVLCVVSGFWVSLGMWF